MSAYRQFIQTVYYVYFDVYNFIFIFRCIVYFYRKLTYSFSYHSLQGAFFFLLLETVFFCFNTLERRFGICQIVESVLGEVKEIRGGVILEF